MQAMEVEIYREGDSLQARVNIPDWAWYEGIVKTVKRNGQVMEFETVYGPAKMVLDTVHGEMIGTVGESNPPLNFHLKKSLRPYRPKLTMRELSIENEGATIGGTLVIPEHATKPMPCAIFVHGRGCGTRNWKLWRAKKLAEYGIATFAYDKRGSKTSGFDCATSTHDLNVSDVSKLAGLMAEQPEIDQVGLISSSAGGWIVPEVAAKSPTPIAFMVTIVGPSTSVLEQQVDGGVAFAQRQGYSQEAIEEGKEYTKLMFTKDNQEQAYERMMQLLDSAKKKGWIDWLVDDDIPESAEAMENLWVQRFTYDPAEDLAQFEGPFLSILGEDDYVVPYQKQIERFKEIFGKAEKTNYSVRVLSAANHGLENGPKVRSLGYVEEAKTRPYYYKYDRVVYGAFQHIVDFLGRYGFLNATQK